MTDPFGDDEFRSALALLADAAPEPRTTDLVAAQAAWELAHRPAPPVRLVTGARRTLRTRPWLAWPAAAALAVAVALVALAVAPSVRLTAPQPAAPPAGPGAVPERLFVAPPWTPSATDAPIARAAYLVEVQEREAADRGERARLMVVGADGGDYRRLPDDAGIAALSPEGSRVAWVRTSSDGGQAVVEVLDLPTGRVRDAVVHSAFGVTTTVDGLAFDGAGRRLAVWGGDSADGVISTGLVVVLDLGEVGLRAPLRGVERCRCAGPLAWLDDGRLAAEPGTPLAVLDRTATAVLPGDPRAEPESTSLGGVGTDLLVDGSGVIRWGVSSQVPSTQSPFEAEPYRLLSLTVAGETSEVPLGEAAEVVGLSVTGDTVVLLRREAVAQDGMAFDGRLTVEAVTAGLRTTLTTADPGVSVLRDARFVTGAGRSVPTPAPAFGARTLGWWSWHARDPLLVVGSAAGLAVGLWLLVLVLSNPWWRWLAQRLRPSRHRLWLVAVTCSAATGLAWLGAAPAVESAWAASAPHPAAAAPVVVPQVLTDQRVRPPRAFDTPGSPRTTRLTVAFSGTVAGRAGVYGLDAGTARLVRLDDLPGVPRGWRSDGGYALAVSPSGRRVALWTDGLPDRRVAVVDLEAARVVLRPDVVHDVGGAAAGVPWSPLEVDDAGVLRPVGRTRTDAAVARFAVLAPTGVLAAQTAPDGTTAGVVRTDEGWTVLGGRGGAPSGQTFGRLPLEGRVAVAAGALGQVAAQTAFGALPEPWWTALGERSRQPVGWLFVALAVLLVLPAAGRRARAWRTMVAGVPPERAPGDVEGGTPTSRGTP